MIINNTANDKFNVFKDYSNSAPNTKEAAKYSRLVKDYKLIEEFEKYAFVPRKE